MLAISTAPDERLTPARRAKLAYIYVRQSSMTQVKHHQESTELQYRLVDRAIALGWPKDRVHVIDARCHRANQSASDRKALAAVGFLPTVLGGELAVPCTRNPL